MENLFIMEARSRKSYDTLSEAVNDLQKMGYNEDFLVQEDGECLFCVGQSLELSPDEFVIDEIFRFEGMTDPGDESILFAISSKDNLIKGLVINSFGAEFSFRSSKLVEELNKRKRDI
ncbi:Uncharacterised protein [Sphingobacterium daejeonense]|nr:Uncharacterised protein [Sphingobacterium daejeonense]